MQMIFFSLSHYNNLLSDFSHLQADLDLISRWLSSSLLTLNSSKSKYMFFTLKPSPTLNSYPPLTINNSPLNRVFSFKYLGVLLSPSLSWSLHISTICSKARKILGLIFRHFYHFSTPVTILRLYTSLVRPILEYCSPVWSPTSVSLSHSLDSIQSFAIKLATKFHSFSLPPSLIPPSLSSRRLHARLKLLFAFSRNIIFFPLPTLQSSPRPPYPIRSYHPMNLIPFRCRTSTFSRSFFPSTILLWNSLPSSLKETLSPSLFSHRLSYYL